MPRHHKLSLLFLLLGSLAQASQSLSAGSGSGSIPNSAPFTNLSSFRLEFRLHGPWTISTIQSIYGSNAFAVKTIFGGIYADFLAGRFRHLHGQSGAWDGRDHSVAAS